MGCSAIFVEQWVPEDHPLRSVRKLTDMVLGSLDIEFDTLYADSGRPSIAQEYTLRMSGIQSSNKACLLVKSHHLARI